MRRGSRAERGSVIFCPFLRLVLLFSVFVIEALPQALPDKFETEIQPIFKTNCIDCHGLKVQTKELNLATREGVLRGSESGPVVVPGKPEESRLYKLVKEGVMPMGKPHLSDRDVAAIRAWIVGANS